MSEIKTLNVEVSFPDILDVDVEFGQTLTKVVAPEKYLGPFEFYPSDEDQVIQVKDKTPVEDICFKSITGVQTITENGTYDVLTDKSVSVNVEPELQPLAIDILTKRNAAFTPDNFDGYNSVTVDEQWDIIIYPIPDDPDKIFNAKWIPVNDGDTIIVEGFGRGRWVGTNGTNKIDPNTWPNTFSTNILPDPLFAMCRFEFTVKTLADDAMIILAGYQWTSDGTHSSNSAYQFRGEYLKCKIIPAE